MTAIEASTVHVAQSGLVVKMEDRKRPAEHDPNERTPPFKKQATSTVNGGGKVHPDADMPWRDDVEVSKMPCAGCLLVRYVLLVTRFVR